MLPDVAGFGGFSLWFCSARLFRQPLFGLAASAVASFLYRLQTSSTCGLYSSKRLYTHRREIDRAIGMRGDRSAPSVLLAVSGGSISLPRGLERAAAVSPLRWNPIVRRHPEREGGDACEKRREVEGPKLELH